MKPLWIHLKLKGDAYWKSWETWNSALNAPRSKERWKAVQVPPHPTLKWVSLSTSSSHSGPAVLNSMCEASSDIYYKGSEIWFCVEKAIASFIADGPTVNHWFDGLNTPRLDSFLRLYSFWCRYIWGYCLNCSFWLFITSLRKWNKFCELILYLEICSIHLLVLIAF